MNLIGHRLGAAGLRWWRVLACLAFVAVVIATHWPRLVLSADAPSDKLIHGISFGVLTFVLWRTRWISKAWIACGAMFAFAAFDESTQMLPFIQRHTSLNDWIADVAGIFCATLLFAPAAQPRSSVARMRARLDDAADRDMFDRPFTWASLAAAAALGVLVGIPLTVALSTTFLFDQRPWQTAFLGGVVFCAGAIAWSWHFALRGAVRRITQRRACFTCGDSITVMAAESGSCSHCMDIWRSAQWVVPCVVHESVTSPSRRATNVGILRGGLRSVAILGSVAAGVVLLGRQVGSGVLFALDASMRDLFSYGFAVTAIGLVMRSVKQAQARVREQEGVRCVACDHDVHLVAAPREQGICPECGRAFVRLETIA